MAKLPIIAIFAVVIIAALAFWWWQNGKEAEVLQLPETEQPASLGSQIYESVSNPVGGKVPETNPFKTETNPLKDVYKNPFE